VPVDLINTNSFDPSRRFSLPNDFALIGDSQTHVLFNTRLASSWEFRNGFLMRRTSEEYFVTEGVYFDPDTNTVPREGLYFHHHRRLYVNQAELVGRWTLERCVNICCSVTTTGISTLGPTSPTMAAFTNSRRSTCRIFARPIRR
jgi:hypothetical protein